jgi:multiple antibiotic resistance protein
MELPIGHFITLYIILLGPLKVFGIYAKATAHADKKLKLQIANVSVKLATLVCVLVAGLGGFLISRFELSIGALAIVMGIFLGHWAWGRAMGIESPREEVPNPEEPTKALAITPIAFPGIVPPQGVALLVLSSTMVFEAYGQSDMLIVMAVLLGVMAANWIFFVSATALMKFPGPLFWMLLSRSLGVVAAVLALQVILFGFRDLGIIN